MYCTDGASVFIALVHTFFLKQQTIHVDCIHIGAVFTSTVHARDALILMYSALGNSLVQARLSALSHIWKCNFKLLFMLLFLPRFCLLFVVFGVFFFLPNTLRPTMPGLIMAE